MLCKMIFIGAIQRQMFLLSLEGEKLVREKKTPLTVLLRPERLSGKG